MKPSIYAGKRILYKDGASSWLIGEVDKRPAEVNEQGVWIAIIPQEFFGKTPEYVKYSEINQIFTEAFKIEDWIKEYKRYFMTKEEYIHFLETEDFNKQTENAYFSDGEYGYYPISKYTKNWIEKQPFEYIVRGD